MTATVVSSPGVISSKDGRSFGLRISTDRGIRIGDFLTFADGAGEHRLGFVEAVDEVTETTSSASGSILGGPEVTEPFRSSVVERAGSDVVSDFLADSGASLPVGQVTAYPSISAGLVPTRLNRHTFWCGQSGSGKTYALGLALEQILLKTRLPMVIFDPNSDFVRLNEARPDADPAAARGLGERDIRILRPGAGPDPLRIRLRTMTPRARAAILRLDPLLDREEYNAMLRLDPAVVIEDPHDLLAYLNSSEQPGSSALAQRLENLGVLDWTVWALDRRCATEVVAERPAATVLDLGGCAHHEEQLAVSLAVLNDLWKRREERRPVLLVIDEAHNLCSPDLESLAGRAVRDQIIQIAAEGRKFGLWLLLSTQRPSKVHTGIVSQCDNLTLMRMNSPNDLAELGALFGFVPPQLLRQSARFRQGEALLAGGFVPTPTVVKVGDRISIEGGVDVRVPMPGGATTTGARTAGA